MGVIVGDTDGSIAVEFSAEIGLSHTIVDEELASPTAHGDLARLQYVRSIAVAKGEVGVLLDQQDRDASRPKVVDDSEDLLHDDRGETQRRLVKEQESWPTHKCTGYREHLLLATGQCSR